VIAGASARSRPISQLSVWRRSSRLEFLEPGARRGSFCRMRVSTGFIIGALLVASACGQADDAAPNANDAAPNANDEAPNANDEAAANAAPGDETPTEETAVDVPADWSRVEAHCGFSFLAPPGVSVQAAVGTDSCIDVWVTSGCMHQGDYGAFSSNLSEYAAEPDYASTRENIQGRAAKLVTVTTAEQGWVAAAHFPELELNGVALTVWASCEDAEGQQAALTSFRTIQFVR
jgi:hypothetical protein